jgi:hypothetical protein
MDDQLSAADSDRSLETTRRNFSVAAIHGMLVTILATLGLPTAAYLLVPSRIRLKDDFVD